MESKEIIGIKPRIGIFEFDVREAWRRVFSKPEQDAVTIVAQRFLQIFEAHGVAVSQIPRLVQGLSLEQLRNVNSLLPVLTPDHLQRVAELFQIRLAWLEGTTDIIYDCHPSYKNPQAFFEDVDSLKVDAFAFPVVAFCSSKKLDYQSNKDQPIVLVLREACAQFGEKTIYRYRIHDQFLWGYWKTRIQLKAMMRVWYKKFKAAVPVYRISPQALAQIEAGQIVPRLYYRNSTRLKGADLEDYSLSPEESRQSKDQEEFDTVLEYIDAYKLYESEASNSRVSRETAYFC